MYRKSWGGKKYPRIGWPVKVWIKFGLTEQRKNWDWGGQKGKTGKAGVMGLWGVGNAEQVAGLFGELTLGRENEMHGSLHENREKTNLGNTCAGNLEDSSGGWFGWRVVKEHCGG